MDLLENVPARSVLVVDNEPEILRDARRWLEDEGFAVTATDSGESGLAAD